MINIRNKHLYFISWIMGFTLSSVLFGSYPVASLPGGLCFPSLSSSGLVNTAALSQDWRRETRLLYSPAIDAENPHSYAALFASSNGIFGFNAGYLGSYQSDIPFHSGFVGASFKIKNLSFGYTARKRDLIEGQIHQDISLLLAPTYYSRVGISIFDVEEETQLALGIGLGKPQRGTFGIDVLFPLNPVGKGLSDQYSLNLTVGKYFERWGYSAAVHFSRQQDGFQNPERLSGQLNITRLLKRNLGGVIQFRTQPQALIFSLVWLGLPSSSDYISRFKGINHKTIWRD